MTDCVCESAGWCERHQCEKTCHWHRLCQTRSEYFQLWEEHRGPGQEVNETAVTDGSQEAAKSHTRPDHSHHNQKPVRKGRRDAKPKPLVRKPRVLTRRRKKKNRQRQFSRPTVAVIVVCHNYGHFLGECLQSVLSQSRPADEVLVVDDRSTDNSREVAATFAEQGVHYLHVDHGNVHRTRESGF